jgi:hypothetical protein
VIAVLFMNAYYHENKNLKNGAAYVIYTFYFVIAKNIKKIMYNYKNGDI